MRLAIVLLAVLATPALAGPCRPQGFGPRVVTPTGAAIGKGGGVVVAAVAGQGDAVDDASSQPTWRFRIGGELVEPERTTVAPGLTVYALPANAAAATLEDEHQTRKADVHLAARDTRVLAAPKARRVHLVVTTHAPHPDGAPVPIQLVLELAAAPPAGALALITYGPDGVARDWVSVEPDGKSIVLSETGRACGPELSARKPSAAGDALTFAWLDTSGRQSALSAAVVVAR